MTKEIEDVSTSPKEMLALARKWAVGFSRKLGIREFADDLAQEALIGMLRAKKTFNPKKASFKTYAYWWAHKEMSNYSYAHTGPTRAPQSSKLVSSRGEHKKSEGSTPIQEEIAAVNIILEKCDPNVRMVAIARLEGRGLREIGDALGCSYEWVRKLESRFLERLAEAQ